jgi:hypothetical protein
MDMQMIKDEVLLKLTGDVVSMELSDAALTKVINSALREVQRYIDTFKMVTVPYKSCIDVSGYKVSAITGVRRSEGYINNDAQNSTSMDPMYASQWMMLSGVGNVGRISEYASNLASWNTMLQIRNTISTDLSFYFDKSDNKLYINVSSDIPKEVTIIYIPRFDDVSQITSDYWQDVLVRMSVAIAKVTVGRVRTKFKQSNALWTLDGDQILEEGNTELTNLRQELKDSTQLCYGVD